MATIALQATWSEEAVAVSLFFVSGSAGTAAAKKEALEAAGVKVGKTPSETAELMREVIASL